MIKFICKCGEITFSEPQDIKKYGYPECPKCFKIMERG